MIKRLFGGLSEILFAEKCFCIIEGFAVGFYYYFCFMLSLVGGEGLGDRSGLPRSFRVC